MTRTTRFLASVLTLGAAVLAFCGSPPLRAQDPDPGGYAMRATELTNAMELDQARAELAKADPNSPMVVLAKARLAVYEEDCDLAVALVGRYESMLGDEGRLVADVARGCARVTAATIVEKDENVVLRFHDENDRALAPLLTETVVKARAALTRDLGVEWKAPTRITVVRDLLSLSAMTGLPYKAAQTTGTVAVAKWGRVTILSPRASKHGYPWRDTLAHELTHLAISMQSHERAPLWLHEGVARRQEQRWREPGPFDDTPSPEAIVLRGIDLKIDYPLDKLGPSIAMLPSADAAMVAFAEVTSFIKYFVESSPPDALARLLVALRATKTADEALKQVSNETLAQWDGRWRGQLARRPKEPLSALFGLGATPPGLGDSRERSRLAELLLGRGHAAQAVVELDKIPEGMLADPSLRYTRARALEASGDARAAEALVEEPSAWIAAFGPCWAIRARLARARGDAATAEPSSVQAIGHDPLAVESACGTLEPGPQGTPLCEAARKRGEPDVGKD